MISKNNIDAESLSDLKVAIFSEQGITLKKLLDNQYSPDLIYYAIAQEEIFVDISTQLLTEPETVNIYTDKETAEAYKNFRTTLKKELGPCILNFEIGASLIIEDNKWRILGVNDENITLTSDDGKQCINISPNNLEKLFMDGKVKGLQEILDNKEVHLILQKASPADRAEANRRYNIIKPFLDGTPKKNLEISKRTLNYWIAAYYDGERKYCDGYVGLIPGISKKGNRLAKIPAETIALMDQVIEEEYETKKQKNILSVFGTLLNRCADLGLHKPSYNALRNRINMRNKTEQIFARKGKRAAYAEEPFYWELDYTTPKHGIRPFEICHIDHTVLDIQLVSSDTFQTLGRPTLTLMIDAFSRRILSFYLSFEKPSSMSCMMAIRSCVQRFNRLPQIIVMDGGKEFESVYFEALLARYEVTKKTRPKARPRNGNVIERMFGTVNTQFLYNLAGNTQITKNVRLCTSSNDPKKLALWTLQGLYEALERYFFNIYDTNHHSTLGLSPRGCYDQSIHKTGERPQRRIVYDKGFIIDTMPSTYRRYAKVNYTRGIKINNIRYWSDAFRDPRIENHKVEVRYDPMDVGIAYAYIRGQWIECHSEFYAELKGRTYSEIKLSSELIRKKAADSNKLHEVSIRQIAENTRLNEVEEQLTIKRMKDAELKRIHSNQLENAPTLHVVELDSVESDTDEELEILSDY